MKKPNYTKQEVFEIIFNTLMRQRFSEWYNNGKCDAFIRGDLPTPTKEDVKKDIEQIFDI